MNHAIFGWQQGWRYGLMGLALAFVALPLYVMLPHFYAERFGVPLATLGALLLGARLLDAFIDPLLGRWSDRLHAHAPQQVLPWAAVAAVLLALGFALLFLPPSLSPHDLLLWAAMGLALTYGGYSALSILHQSWGARLGGDEIQRARVVAWREGLGLLGVVLACVAPLLLGMAATSALFTLALALGWYAWSQAPRPPTPARPLDFAQAASPALSLWLPFRRPQFRALLAVFILNGVASAVPATLVLFFVRDRLQAPALEGAFLAAYFVAGALSLPLWVRAVARWGLVRTWAAGMVLAVVTFVGALALGAGDTGGFLAVCLASGLALGADLVVPGALLAGIVRRSGQGGAAEGAFFGWWNSATKLNLALAAGLALPALQWAGYTPGSREADALWSLSLAYAALPCGLKLLALGALWRLRRVIEGEMP